MWVIMGLLCAAGNFACLEYPANGQTFTREARCKQAIIEAFEQRGSFDPYASVRCKYQPSQRRQE
jgi:hypothetical protein